MPEIRTESGFYPPSPPSEDSKWWSWQRAKRGAKIGAAIGLGFSGLVVLLSGQISPEDINLEVVNYVTKVALFLGSTGAVIDGFKPTSKLISKSIEHHINAVTEVASGVGKLIHTDYRKLAYDILRPEVDEETLKNKAKYMGSSLIYGLCAGVGTYVPAFLVGKVMSSKPEDFSSKFFNTITDHPIEWIGGYTALILGIGAYKLAFHRPSSHPDLALH